MCWVSGTQNPSLPDQLQDQLRDHGSCALWSYDCALCTWALHSTVSLSPAEWLCVWRTQTNTFSTAGLSQSCPSGLRLWHTNMQTRTYDMMSDPAPSHFLKPGTLRAHSQGQMPKDADALQLVKNQVEPHVKSTQRCRAELTSVQGHKLTDSLLTHII